MMEHNLKVVSIHGRAGARPELPEEPEGRLRVIMFHQLDQHQKHGCGALGSFNRGGLKDTLEQVWDDLHCKLDLNPEVFFGLSREQAFTILRDLNLPNDAKEYASRVLYRVKNDSKGQPTIVAIHGHADGTVQLLGHAHLEKFVKGKGIAISVCSDARSPWKAALLVAQHVLSASEPLARIQIQLPDELIAPNPRTQAPRRIVIHSPKHLISKELGETFNITPMYMHEFPENLSDEERQIAILDKLSSDLSLAYALLHFGIGEHRSVKEIVVTDRKMFDALKTKGGQNAIAGIPIRLLIFA